MCTGTRFAHTRRAFVVRVNGDSLREPTKPDFSYNIACPALSADRFAVSAKKTPRLPFLLDEQSVRVHGATRSHTLRGPDDKTRLCDTTDAKGRAIRSILPIPSST